MKMTPVQNEICKLVYHILNSSYYRINYSKHGLKDIFKQAIRQFPESNSEDKKSYKNVALCLRHHRISERATKIIDNHDGKTDLWQLLHYEQIVPVSVTISDLLNLGENPNLEAVRDILGETEVVILSKEEAKILDGNVDSMYPLDGKSFPGRGLKSKGSKAERLNSVKIITDKRYVGNGYCKIES
jgi:hypothetical protein